MAIQGLKGMGNLLGFGLPLLLVLSSEHIKDAAFLKLWWAALTPTSGQDAFKVKVKGSRAPGDCSRYTPLSHGLNETCELCFSSAAAPGNLRLWMCRYSLGYCEAWACASADTNCCRSQSLALSTFSRDPHPHPRSWDPPPLLGGGRLGRAGWNI